MSNVYIVKTEERDVVDFPYITNFSSFETKDEAINYINTNSRHELKS